MFRGIGVTTFRVNGFSEGRVALWSSVVFGAVHLTNALSTGGAAVAQAIAVSFAGYFFYLTRRVSGGLVVPAVLHGLFDFSILSGAVAATDVRGASRRSSPTRWSPSSCSRGDSASSPRSAEDRSGREWQAPLEDQLQSVDVVDLLADTPEPERADQGEGRCVVRTDGGDARPDATGRPSPLEQPSDPSRA